jgi:hypothetical protein
MYVQRVTRHLANQTKAFEPLHETCQRGMGLHEITICAPLQNRLVKRPVDASSVLLTICRKALGKGRWAADQPLSIGQDWQSAFP